MEINEDLIEVLNDLIQINNDRIEGYKRAIKDSEDSDVDLKAIFSKLTDESRQYVSELTREVIKLGGEPATGTTASGKIYRTWMNVKATFSGSDRHSILASCEYGEDAAQKAYKDALESDETLSLDIRQLIDNQKASLKISHDTIKKYRDMSEDNSNDYTSASGGVVAGNLGNTENYNSANRSGKISGTGVFNENEDVIKSRNNTSEVNLSDIDTQTDDLSDRNKNRGPGNISGSDNLRNNL